MTLKSLLTLPLVLALACSHAQAKKPEAPVSEPEPSLEEQLTRGLPKDNGLIAAEECGGAHWAPTRLPIQVYMDPTTAEWSGIMKDGLEWWGPEMFVIWDQKPLEAALARGEEPNAYLPDMLITTDPYMFGQAVTELQFSISDCVIQMAIITMPELPMAPGFHMFIHELGHALGLDHDADKDSIMYPTVQGAYLAPNDRARLLEAYGKPAVAYP